MPVTPCSRCGAADRYKSGACRPCQIARALKWQKDNPEKANARNRKWHKNNSEKVNASKRESRKANPPKPRPYAQRKAANPEQVAATACRSAATRRARLRDATVDPNCPKVEALYQLAAFMRADGLDVHVDHIHPLARGGVHAFENLRIIPAHENRKKGAKTMDELNPKDRVGQSKPGLSAMSMPALFEVANALREGARKYGAFNVRATPVRAGIYFDATMRHLAAWWEGQDIDPDSGIHHVSKAIASLLVLRDAMIHEKVVDDRPPRTDEGWIVDAAGQCAEIDSRYPEPKQPHTQKDIEARAQAVRTVLEAQAESREAQIREQFEGGPIGVDLATEPAFTARAPIYSKPTKVRPKLPECPQDFPADAEELDQ